MSDNITVTPMAKEIRLCILTLLELSKVVDPGQTYIYFQILSPCLGFLLLFLVLFHPSAVIPHYSPINSCFGIPKCS